MLRLLLGRPGRVFSRTQLLDVAHADLRDVSDRAIDSHIKNLRRKIQAMEPGCECIASVYGVGYRFDAPE
jgi:two-component system, OmpR family, response regulator BaeR